MMRVVRADVRLRLLELLRTPAFVLPLAAFPTVLYLAIGVGAGVGDERRVVLLGFLAFAILGTMMFQFGVGIAASRDAPWTGYASTLPSAPWQRALALLASGAVLAALFCVPVVVSAAFVGVPASHDVVGAAGVAGVLLLGGVVHGLLGIALGHWLPARGALGIANLLYFPLAFVGGMLGRVEDPAVLAVQPWTSTGAWMRALWAADAGALDARDVATLLAFGALFAGAALLGIRRSERTAHR